MATDRWHWLDRLKKETAIEAVVKQMAGIVAEQLSNWPPTVDWQGTSESSRFAELYEPGAARPSLAAFEEATRRARWELQRNFDAINFYERNHHLAKACPTRRDQVASEFIQHYILESFFSLMERTEYRVKRADVLIGVDLVERLIQAS